MWRNEIRNEARLPSVPGLVYHEGGIRDLICCVGKRASWEPGTGRTVTGTLFDAAGFPKLMRIDDWNDVVIRAEGNRSRHFRNARLILDFTDNDPTQPLTRGVLALQ